MYGQAMVPSFSQKNRGGGKWERRLGRVFWFRNLTSGQVGVPSMRAEQNRKLCKPSESSVVLPFPKKGRQFLEY